MKRYFASSFKWAYNELALRVAVLGVRNSDINVSCLFTDRAGWWCFSETPLPLYNEIWSASHKSPLAVFACI
jgi:hypothetical protein